MTPTTATPRGKVRRGAPRKPIRDEAAKTIIVTVSASKARQEFSSWISIVSHGHKWLVLKRHGKPAVAMVPVADLEALRDLEDAVDLEAARRALSEPGEVPWDEVKARLGI